MHLPPQLNHACRHGRLLVVWGALPLPLAAHPPANRLAVVEKWTRTRVRPPPHLVSLVQLPRLPIVSLDPGDRVERALEEAGVRYGLVRSQEDVPPREGFCLIKLGGDLGARTGLLLSRAEVRDMHGDPAKRRLLGEARRRLGADGALLLLGADPANEDLLAWWAVLHPALGAPPAFALGEPAARWPEGVTCLGADFDALNDALWTLRPR